MNSKLIFSAAAMDLPLSFALSFSPLLYKGSNFVFIMQELAVWKHTCCIAQAQQDSEQLCANLLILHLLTQAD